MSSSLLIYLFIYSTGVSCLQALNSISSHAKVPDADSDRAGKDGLPPAKQQRAGDAHSNIFVLRKMVEEVFSVLYSKNVANPVLTIFCGGCFPDLSSLFGLI